MIRRKDFSPHNQFKDDPTTFSASNSLDAYVYRVEYRRGDTVADTTDVDL